VHPWHSLHTAAVKWRTPPAQHLPSTPYAGSCNVGWDICLAARRSILFHNPKLKVHGGTCIRHPTTQYSLYSTPYTLPVQSQLVHRQFSDSLLPNIVNWWQIIWRGCYIKWSQKKGVIKQLQHLWILLQPQFDAWLQYLNQSRSSAHHMYHLLYGYIHNQSKIKLLILPSFQASTWCSWELHSLGILSFIIGHLLPRILRTCSGFIFKFYGQTDHWMTDPWQRSHCSLKTLGNKHPVTELSIPEEKDCQHY